MVLQCPDDLRAARVSASPLSLVSPSSNAANSDHHHHHPTIASSMLCDSPMSSSSVSTSPSTSTTSSSSVTPNNDGDDKPTETTPFIDPEDVIGRRVMFDLPPLMMDSGWGVPLDTNSASPETCSEVDFRNVTSPTITSLSGDGLVATGGLPFSSEHGKLVNLSKTVATNEVCLKNNSACVFIRETEL